MKQALLFFIFILSTLQLVQGQQISTTANQQPIQSYDSYISKQKANKTAAWICLGSGIVMTATGIGINMSGGLFDGDSTNNNKGLWLSYLGGATTIASIPLFISAGINKRKAKMSLKNESVSIGNSTISNLNYTAISLTIPF